MAATTMTERPTSSGRPNPRFGTTIVGIAFVLTSWITPAAATPALDAPKPETCAYYLQQLRDRSTAIRLDRSIPAFDESCLFEPDDWRATILPALLKRKRCDGCTRGELGKRRLPAVVHASGPSGSGRLWTIRLAYGRSLRTARFLCFSTETLGFRAFLTHGLGAQIVPLPFLDDLDEDGISEFVIWWSTPLHAEASFAEFAFGMTVYQLEQDRLVAAPTRGLGDRMFKGTCHGTVPFSTAHRRPGPGKPRPLACPAGPGSPHRSRLALSCGRTGA